MIREKSEIWVMDGRTPAHHPNFGYFFEYNIAKLVKEHKKTRRPFHNDFAPSFLYERPAFE